MNFKLPTRVPRNRQYSSKVEAYQDIIVCVASHVVDDT